MIEIGPTQSAEQGPAPFPRPAESASRRLHPANAEVVELDTSILTEIAAGLAAAIDGVEPAPAGSIERILLLATAGYDAWLMVWGPGAALAAHDHDGSIGVLRVIEGELYESATDFDDPEPDPLRRLEAGATSEFAASSSHELSNPGGQTAVAIGVYSPPLGRSSG